MGYAHIVEPKYQVVSGSVESITIIEGMSREATIKPGHVVSNYKTDGTDDFGIIRGNGLLPVLGFAGLEQSYLANVANPADYGTMRPKTPSLAFPEDCPIPILVGGNTFLWPWLTRGTLAKKGQVLFSWGGGEVIPGFIGKRGITVMIPFTKKATEFDTALLIPQGIRITGAGVLVETAAESATIDVGILSSLSGGDADGFINGASLATAGYVNPVLDDASAGNLTVGALLAGTTIKSADSTALYFTREVPYTIPNATMRLSYTTSNHTVAGYILLSVEGEGIIPVARCQKTTDATTETKRVGALAMI